MKKFAFTVLAIPLSLLLLGCNKDAARPDKSGDSEAKGGPAVVDIIHVAKAMGWEAQMKKNLQQTQDTVGGQLNAMLEPARAALEARRAEIVKSNKFNPAQTAMMQAARSRADLERLGIPAAQIDELEKAMARMNSENMAATQQLNQKITEQQGRILAVFREQIKPAVRRVAMGNNKSVVLMIPDDAVLYFDSNSADISDKVVDDLQHSSGPGVQMPTIPRLPVALPQTQPTTQPK